MDLRDDPVIMVIGEGFLYGFSLNSVTIVIGLAGLVVGALAVLYARRALWPARRQIEISLVQVSPILTATYDKMSLNYDGRQLQSPHVCSVRIQSVGRYSVSSAQFDQGQPIEISVGVGIVEILDISNTLSDVKSPDIRISGEQIQIYPSLLAKGQIVGLTVLTDGSPTVSITHRLVDTDVQLSLTNFELSKAQERKAATADRLSIVSLITTAVAAASAIFLVTTYVEPTIVKSSPPPSSPYLSPYIPPYNVYYDGFSISPSHYFFLYPTNGVLPTNRPIISDRSTGVENSVDACSRWGSWASSNGAIPIANSINLTISNPRIGATILNIKSRLLGALDLTGNDRLRCSIPVQTIPVEHYRINLDQPALTLFPPLTITTDSSIYIGLEGTPGRTYKYVLDIEFRQRDSIQTQTIGSVENPLMVSFERANPDGLIYYDWNESVEQWTRVVDGYN